MVIKNLRKEEKLGVFSELWRKMGMFLGLFVVISSMQDIFPFITIEHTFSLSHKMFFPKMMSSRHDLFDSFPGIYFPIRGKLHLSKFLSITSSKLQHSKIPHIAYNELKIETGYRHSLQYSHHVFPESNRTGQALHDLTQYSKFLRPH